jgi:dienelactone hydrolase
MKKYFLIVFFIGFVSLTKGYGQQSPYIASAKTYFDDMMHGKYHEAYLMLDSSVMKIVTEEKNKTGWNAIMKKIGNFRQIENTRTESVQSFTAAFLTCRFDSARLDIKFVFNQHGKIAGYFFVPPVEYKLPTYADTSATTEKAVAVKTGNFSLPAILTLPKKGDHFPVLVLVHGSGPNDKDETIENNKPFKDLALGLAKQGIATLRYDKRTYIYGVNSIADPAKLTLKEETVDDAISALHLVQKLPEIDQKKVFLLGHSLGAMCAPRIATQTPFLAGVIMMAGNARPFEDVFADQMSFLLPLQHSKKEADSLIREINKQVALIKRGDFSDSTVKFGLPPTYWLDMKKYDQVATAKLLAQPMLLLQGEKDYQVTMKDFTLWKNALSAKPNAAFISYPGLYHLFMAGDGRPEDYNKAGHVSEKVITDIAAWVKK